MLTSFRAGYRVEVGVNEESRSRAVLHEYEFNLPPGQVLEQVATAKAPMPHARRHVPGSRKRTRTQNAHPQQRLARLARRSTTTTI